MWMLSDFMFLWLGTLKARLRHCPGRIDSRAELYSTGKKDGGINFHSIYFVRDTIIGDKESRNFA